MKRIFLFLFGVVALLRACSPAYAYTVGFSITNFDMTLATNSVRVYRASESPLLDGTRLVMGSPVTIPVTNGSCAKDFLAGNYEMRLVGYTLPRPVYFVVPEGSGSNDVTQLRISGVNFFKYSPGVQAVIAGTNVVFVTNSAGVVTIHGTATGGGTSGALTNNNDLPGVNVGSGIGTNITTLATAANLAAASALADAKIASSTNLVVQGITNGNLMLNGVGKVYDVRAYGADPTGVNPSQTAIQAAIDAACVDPSKPVYIPAGTYIMGNTEPKRGFSAEYVLSCLTVWSNNVVIIGDGPTLSVLKPGGNFTYQRNFFGVPDRRTLDIASATSSGTTVTMNTTTPHGLTTGDKVDVNNVTPSGYNSVGYHGDGNPYIVTVVDADTFTYTVATANMAAATLTTASLINDMTPEHYLIHTNLTVKGIGFDMENRGLANQLYDTTQIYNVVGNTGSGGASGTGGVLFENCHFLRNANNDGIDVQGFAGVWGDGIGNLTVIDCLSSQNGGDALGIQCGIVTIINTVLEHCGQEGLELNDYEDTLINVTVRNCDNVATIDTYNRFTAMGCTFTGTNASDYSLNIGQAFTTRHIAFNNCVFEESRSSTFSTIYLGSGTPDSVSVNNCEIRGTGNGITKPFILAENGNQISIIGNSFGRDGGYGNYFNGVGANLLNCFDVHIADNVFFSSAPSIIITNGGRRIVISDNTFNGSVSLAGSASIGVLTNVTLSGNLFGNGYGNSINLTNIMEARISGNGPTRLFLGVDVTNNTFSGNAWLNEPSVGYWTNHVAGDVVTNSIVFGGRKDSRITRPVFNSGVNVVGTSDVNSPGIFFTELGVGFGGHGFDAGSHRFSVNGVKYWSASATQFGEFNANQILAATFHKAGNGSVSAPAITFHQTNGDNDSGLFRLTEDHIGIGSGAGTPGTGTLRATTTTTNLFIPNARIDQLVLTTNAAPADAVVVKRWIRVIGENGETYLLPGYQ
jgi:hypothetical protein